MIVSKDVAMTVREKIDKALRSVQRRYKLHKDQHLQFPRTFEKGDELYLDRPLRIRSVSETSATKGDNK